VTRTRARADAIVASGRLDAGRGDGGRGFGAGQRGVGRDAVFRQRPLPLQRPDVLVVGGDGLHELRLGFGDGAARTPRAARRCRRARFRDDVAFADARPFLELQAAPAARPTFTPTSLL
jgi:hypothetical protein